jgi:hypothetical protein
MERQDCLVNPTILLEIEVVGLEKRGDAEQRFRINEKGTENRLLGFDAVGN